MVNLLALVLAAATIGVCRWMDARSSRGLLAILLGLAAGIYVGFAVADGRHLVMGYESGVALIFLVLATAGLRGRGGLLAAGYFLHGGWDTLHHFGQVARVGTPWYPLACLLYDVVIGIYVLVDRRNAETARGRP